MSRRTQASVAQARANAHAAIKEAVSASREGANPDHLGDLAWWDPNPGWRGDVSAVADAFQAQGFDPAQVLPVAPDWSTAFGRALTHVKAGLQKRDLTLIDAAPGPNGERRVAIVKLQRQDRLRTTDEGTVVCPKDGSKPFIERPDPAGVAAEVVAVSATYHERYISDDVRVAVVDAFTLAAAMPCRNRIPYIVYWMPPTGGDVLRRLADAVEACGWGRIEIFAGYASDARSAKACVTAVNSGLETQLAEFREKVTEYTEADPSRTRPRTLEKAIEEAAALRSRGTLYRTILGAAVDSIDEQVAAIETQLRSTLGLVEAAAAAKKAA